MEGKKGLSENTAFYGYIISNSAVVVFAPLTPSLSRLLGTRTAVILSVILCGTIDNALFYPTDYFVYTAFLLNGIGCALLRVSSLAYMTKNSTRQTLSRNNSIHWMMLTVGLMLGNLIVMLVNITTTQIDDDKRYAIAVATSTLCILAIPGYFFTKNIPDNYDDMLADQVRDQIHEEIRSPADERTGFTSFPHHGSVSLSSQYAPITEDDARDERSVGNILAGMYHIMLRSETIWLLMPMFAAGVYSTACSPIIPTAVCNQANKPWLISAFGILAGLGQLAGAFLIGRSIDKVSLRKLASVISGLAVLSFGLVALIVEMGLSSTWVQWRSFSQGLVLLLAFFIGTCDMANNVCLSVAIGRLYGSQSDPAFSLFITVLSVSMITWYLFVTLTHSHFYIILILYSIASVAAAFSYACMEFDSGHR